MREAIGSTFIINLIIIFVIIFIVLFAASTNYTKAFKVKNRIISIIEENNGYNPTAKEQIETFLGETGYRISYKGCKKSDYHYQREIAGVKNGIAGGNWESVPSGSNYKYCIEKVTTKNGEIEQTFYGVTAYAYFEFPLLSSLIEIPVYGETKTMGLMGK